jgi:hypothetical protein
LKLFLDKLELKDVDLVGHDLGAGVAMVFAATYPHRVRKLVLLAPPLDGLATDALGPWWRWPLAGEVWSFFFLNQEWYRRWLTQGWTSPYASWQPVVEQYYRPLSTQAGRRGFLAVLRGCTGFAYNSYQERLQVPTLVIRGADDPFCPPGPLVRLQAALPQIIVKTLPQVGHFLPEEAPRQTYEMIREFIGVAERPEVLPEPAPQPEAAPALPPAPAPKPATAGRKRNALARAVERAKPVPQPTVTLILAPAMPAAAEPPAAVPAVAPAPAVPAAASDTREPAASAPTPAAQPAPALQP